MQTEPQKSRRERAERIADYTAQIAAGLCAEGRHPEAALRTGRELALIIVDRIEADAS